MKWQPSTGIESVVERVDAGELKALVVPEWNPPGTWRGRVIGGRAIRFCDSEASAKAWCESELTRGTPNLPSSRRPQWNSFSKLIKKVSRRAWL